MNEFEQALKDAQDEIEAERSAYGQFAAGAERGATFGESGGEMPEDLPLSSRVGRMAGEMAGSLPFFAATGPAGEAAGLSRLGTEMVAGGIYGGLNRPEEGETRLGNAAKNAALFGATHAVFSGLGRVFERRTGREIPTPAEEIGKETFRDTAPGILSPEDIQSPADLEAAAGIGERGLAERVPAAAPYSTEAGTMNMFGGMSPAELPPEALTNPKAFKDAMEATMWDKTIKPVVENMAKGVEDSAVPVALTKLLAEPGNVEEASQATLESAGLKNIGEASPLDQPAMQTTEPLKGNLLAQADLQHQIDEVAAKNGIKVKDLAQAAQVAEPINFLMSKGANFEDASDLVDKVIERSTVDNPTLTPPEISSPAEAPDFNKIKTRALSPDEIHDMFFNVPIKGPEAIKYGMAVPSEDGNSLKLTDKGYQFLRKYNPEFGVALPEPIKGLEGVSRRVLGAIRGQGYSNLDLSPGELKQGGLKMPIQKALLNDMVREGKNPETYQLTSKGAGMLAGGKGLNAGPVKAFDIAAGTRAATGDTEGIARLAAQREKTDLLFKDIWEEQKGIGTGLCDHEDEG